MASIYESLSIQNVSTKGPLALTRLCSPLRNNGIQRQQAIINVTASDNCPYSYICKLELYMMHNNLDLYDMTSLFFRQKKLKDETQKHEEALKSVLVYSSFNSSAYDNIKVACRSN